MRWGNLAEQFDSEKCYFRFISTGSILKLFPMFEILTAAEMRKAENAAIAGGVPGIYLMNSAGAGTANSITEAFTPCPVLVLCGPGNNGGDGFIVAQCLKKAGWPVRVACLVRRNALKNDALLASQQWDGEIENLNSNL